MLKKFISLTFCSLAVLSCSNTPNTTEDFPASLLTEFLTWSPVLSGDRAFASSGHSGQTTRVYFNPTAAPSFASGGALPFPVDSIIAKAVVADADTPATAATRVYFMRKKEASFDPTNESWSYAFAELNNGVYEFNASMGKVASCISCHANESEWDYVRTVEYHRNDTAP